MSKYYNDTKYQGSKGFIKPGSPKRPWLTVIKWVAGSCIVIILLLVAACIGVICYLTPGRLSQIISKEASHYIDGKVEIGDVHYTLFRSWPWLDVEIDSLRVISHSLDNLPDSVMHLLPSDASTLLSTGKIEGKINIKDLFEEKIKLGDILVTRPSANIIQINDSLANFNILPPMKKKNKMKLPKIDMRSVKIEEPLNLTYFNLSQNVEAKLTLNNLELGKGKKKHNFDVDLGGVIDVKTDEIALSRPLPFNLNGQLAFDTTPLFIKLYDFKIDAGPLANVINLSMSENNGEDIIENFELQSYIGNIFDIKDYLPVSYLDLIEKEIKYSGDCAVKVNLSLESPLNLSQLIASDTDDVMKLIPSLVASLQISDGVVILTHPVGPVAEIDDILVNCEARYDAANPVESYINLSNLSFREGGMNFEAGVDVQHLLSPMMDVEGNVRIHANLPQTLQSLMHINNIHTRGNLLCVIDIKGGIPSIKDFQGENISIKGTVSSPGLSLSTKGMKGDISAFNLNFNGYTPQWSQGASLSGNLSVDLKMGAGNMAMGDTSTINVKKFEFSADVANLKNNKSIPLNFDIALSSASLQVDQPHMSASLNGFKLDVVPASGDSQTAPSSISSLYSSENDSIILQRVNHTQAWLAPGVGTMLDMLPVSPQISLIVNNGNFSSDAYLSEITFGNVDISTDINNIFIRNVNATAANSSLTLNGKICNLKNFLSTLNPSPLMVDMNLDFTNVDINRLSGAYYAAWEKLNGKPYDFTMAPQAPYTAADSLCVLIPRNIQADIKLHSLAAEYMGYRFTPLSTDIIVNNGNATLSNLSIGAPYTNVTVDWTYSTHDADSIYMDISANVKDFNFKRFFAVFPELTDKAPEINNLSGVLDAEVSSGFQMFPSMFLNIASLTGKFAIHGNDLTFARAGKIEKITHLMRIEGSEPIAISNLNIYGSFHDNLLQLNPFKINFDDYQIGVAGVNNLNNEMYYHLALEKSPFHLPFAVNLVGKFSHPEVRFGGTEVKDGRERLISSDLESKVDVNIMTYLRRGWQMFIEAAAKWSIEHGEESGK